MKIPDMLAMIIKFNREMMDNARKAMCASEVDSVEWQEAYQILLDCEKAFDDASRASQYGFPGIER